MTASAQHDLSRTSFYSLLEQRFMGYAVEPEAAAVRYVEGYCDMSAKDLVEAIETLIVGAELEGVLALERQAAWLGLTEAGVRFWICAHGGTSWDAGACGPDPGAVGSFIERLRKALPSGLPDEDNSSVWVTFWAMGGMGPFSYTRRLAASRWDDVAGNYPAGTSAELGKLMAMEPPSTGGRLMLMHGPPGTGKTHCIRALAQAWRDWATVDYIVDADEFFGRAAYMVQALIVGGDDADRWRVVVIEDAGEYLISEAAIRTGQGLSRLLNLVDGLVGQGLRLIVVMTTNEPIDELHPAVTRPGRCMASLELGRFDVEEANAWLASRRPGRLVQEPATLAELYALL